MRPLQSTCRGGDAAGPGGRDGAAAPQGRRFGQNWDSSQVAILIAASNPPETLQGRGGRWGVAPSVSVSPFPASPQVSSPPSWSPQWTAPRLVPAGAAGVIPPGRGRLLARRLAAHRRAQGASGQYWILNVRSGGISPPAVPGIRGCLLRRFPVCRRPLESQSRAQLLGDELLVQDLGTKSLPPGVATPLNSAFQRLAEARCWRAAKGGDELFFEGGKSPQTPASLCRDSKGSLFASPGRWVPSIAQRAKGVK